MKKFFTAMIFCLMICSTAAAQDIYATSKDGYDYYVMTETVNERNYTANVSGKNYPVKEVTCDVKLIRNGRLIETQAWKFSSFNYRTWQYSFTDSTGREQRGSFSALNSLYAQQILETAGRN